MKVNLALLKFVALILFVLCAILFFADVRYDVTWGLFALAFACRVAADIGK
jgi:hypothetical protein